MEVYSWEIFSHILLSNCYTASPFFCCTWICTYVYIYIYWPDKKWTQSQLLLVNPHFRWPFSNLVQYVLQGFYHWKSIVFLWGFLATRRSCLTVWRAEWWKCMAYGDTLHLGKNMEKQFMGLRDIDEYLEYIMFMCIIYIYMYNSIYKYV